MTDAAAGLRAMEGGTYRYEFTRTLPSDASRHLGCGLEGYMTEELKRVSDPVRVAGFNPVVYVALDDSSVEPRRKVVRSRPVQQLP